MYVCPLDYDNGLKLMEHSWVGTRLTQAVETLLYNKPQQIAWAGDYDENHDFYKQGTNGNKVQPTISSIFTDKERNKHTFYIVNRTKKCAVRIPDMPAEDCKWWEMKVHPLPLLTATSNGLGGGDYYGKANADKVGTWATDLIEVREKVPQGYEIQDIVFVEEY